MIRGWLFAGSSSPIPTACLVQSGGLSPYFLRDCVIRTRKTYFSVVVLQYPSWYSESLQIWLFHQASFAWWVGFFGFDSVYLLMCFNLWVVFVTWLNMLHLPCLFFNPNCRFVKLYDTQHWSDGRVLYALKVSKYASRAQPIYITKFRSATNPIKSSLAAHSITNQVRNHYSDSPRAFLLFPRNLVMYYDAL